MACANPFLHKRQIYTHGLYDLVKIPCGYCLNCRKDKQQYYIDRAEYEYKKRLTASFVTFTYNDVWNIARCAVKNPLGGFEYDIAKDGSKVPRFTLRYDDLTHFIDSIRHYIVNHPEIQNVMCQPDFSYMYCGEYGDVFNRNHFHVLFFGLDFAYCKKIIFDKWKYGFIDVLPLLDGGIKYVCKYMDKQLHGDLAYLTYDVKGLARPKIRMSQGFGQGLLKDNIDFIKENNMCYPAKHNTVRPISAYWKTLLTGNTLNLDTSKTYKAMCFKKAREIAEMKSYHLKDFSKKSRESFKLKKNLNREHDLEIRCRNAGIPVETFKNIRFSKFFSPSYHHEIINIPIDAQRLLSENYRDSLFDSYDIF